MFTEKFSKRLIYLGVILLLTAIILFLIKTDVRLHLPIDTEIFAQFGDFIGGLIGAIWALAGVLLFYIALRDQKMAFEEQKKAIDAQIQSLEIQTQEFKVQKKELEETRVVLKDQSRTFKMQQFDSTFFQLLGFFRNSVMNINLEIISMRNGNIESQKILRGIDCFREYLNVLKSLYDKNFTARDEYLRMKSATDELIAANKGDLHNYFNLLLSILEFISVSPENKRSYMRFCQHQLSLYELIIINYYLFSEYCNEDLKEYVRDFNILTLIDKSYLIKAEHLFQWSEETIDE